MCDLLLELLQVHLVRLLNVLAVSSLCLCTIDGVAMVALLHRPGYPRVSLGRVEQVYAHDRQGPAIPLCLEKAGVIGQVDDVMSLDLLIPQLPHQFSCIPPRGLKDGQRVDVRQRRVQQPGLDCVELRQRLRHQREVGPHLHQFGQQGLVGERDGTALVDEAGRARALSRGKALAGPDRRLQVREQQRPQEARVVQADAAAWQVDQQDAVPGDQVEEVDRAVRARDDAPHGWAGGEALDLGQHGVDDLQPLALVQFVVVAVPPHHQFRVAHDLLSHAGLKVLQYEGRLYVEHRVLLCTIPRLIGPYEGPHDVTQHVLHAGPPIVAPDAPPGVDETLDE